jgi:hypothetical protein
MRNRAMLSADPSSPFASRARSSAIAAATSSRAELPDPVTRARLAMHIYDFASGSCDLRSAGQLRHLRALSGGRVGSYAVLSKIVEDDLQQASRARRWLASRPSVVEAQWCARPETQAVGLTVAMVAQMIVAWLSRTV